MTAIIDSKLLYYGEAHRHKPPIGLFDSLANMLKYIEDTTGVQFKKLIMVYDIGKSSYRQGIWPHYKAKRVYSHLPANFKTTYEMQVPVVAEALGMRNFPIHGLEADDLAGLLCTKIKDEITLITSDQDWWQLVIEHPERVQYFYVKNRELLGVDDVIERSGCTSVEQFLIKKAATDDTGDNIRGIVGIGPIKFKAWAEEMFKLPDSELRDEYLRLCTRCITLKNKKYLGTPMSTHTDYHEFGISTCQELYDFNMKLGRIMTDLSLLTVKQKVDVKVCYAMPLPPLNIQLAQDTVAAYSDGHLSPFGDPYHLSPVSTAYYEEVYNRRNT